MNERIKRIQEMEVLLDQLDELIPQTEQILDRLTESLPNLKTLLDYSEIIWMEDHRADERNEIPKDLKRGVLSEDAIYNLLYDYRNLAGRMKSITEKIYKPSEIK